MSRPLKILMGIAILSTAFLWLFAYEQYLRDFQKSIIVLATTTSTYDSGLLDYLMPIFERKYNAEVHIISVGTGQAIETLNAAMQISCLCIQGSLSLNL
jgi:tungstate transport system substrate-binding protein